MFQGTLLYAGPTYVVPMAMYNPNSTLLSAYTVGRRPAPSTHERELGAIRLRIEQEHGVSKAAKPRRLRRLRHLLSTR